MSGAGMDGPNDSRGAPLATETRMICRLWRGWATPQMAESYERIVRTRVIPGIEALGVHGFRRIDLLRRINPGEEVEFTTLMWFDDLEAVKAFAGEHYEVSHVPEYGRHTLVRYDERAAHFEVLDRRAQGGESV
jgi:hypothetical protein